MNKLLTFIKQAIDKHSISPNVRMLSGASFSQMEENALVCD